MGDETIGIVGAGAWGTALAQSLATAGRAVRLWALEPETVASIAEQRQNSAYLPDVTLAAGIEVTGRLEDMADRDVLLLATPAQHTRAVAARLQPHVPPGRPAVICAKGIEQASGKRMSEVLAGALPQAVPAILTGPSFAVEVARGLPTAITLACAEQALGMRLLHSIGHPALRPYWTDDLIGAEVGGAVKNVLAIAAGVVDGKGLGRNAHAALITRGFAELVRFGTALGARAETLTGLSGLGDLVLTSSSTLSRNMSLGRALGQGRTLEDIMAERMSISEGVFSASAVARIAAEHGIEMPIAQAVDAILTGSVSVDDAIGGLLRRPFKAEH